MSLTSQAITEDIRRRAARVRLLALDSDGVLTDGGIYVDDEGREFRRFNIKDGLGLKQVMAAGIHVVIISGAESSAVIHRAHSLGITEVYVGIQDKLALLREICDRLDINLDQVAYMGDDLPDVSVLEMVGLPCAPDDAVHSVLNQVKFVTGARGGYGAVRELCAVLNEVQK